MNVIQDGSYRVNTSDDAGTPTGILIDGVIYGLQGQPPTATTDGWFTGHVQS